MKLLPNLKEPPHAGWALVLAGLLLLTAGASAVLLRASARWERAAYIEYGFALGAFGAEGAVADSLRALVGERRCVAWWPPELRARKSAK